MSADLLAVVKQLGHLARDLDKAVDELASLEMAAVDAEGDYKVTFARAFRDGQGPVEDRKQAAIAETVELWRSWGKAAAAVRLQREHIRALSTRIDVGRTLQSTARAEMQMAGGS